MFVVWLLWLTTSLKTAFNALRKTGLHTYTFFKKKAIESVSIGAAVYMFAYQTKHVEIPAMVTSCELESSQN